MVLAYGLCLRKARLVHRTFLSWWPSNSFLNLSSLQCASLDFQLIIKIIITKLSFSWTPSAFPFKFHMLWDKAPLENSVYFAIFKTEVWRLLLLNSEGSPRCLALERETTHTTEQWGKKPNNGKFIGVAGSFWLLLNSIEQTQPQHSTLVIESEMHRSAYIRCRHIKFI